MPIQPRNPDTHKLVASWTEFRELARQTAGLDYSMDDPTRPFTPEYDAPALPDVDAEIQTNPLQARVERFISEKVRPAAAAESPEDGREDAWASLGAGHNTYHAEGVLPAGSREAISVQRARGPGGRLVHRVELNNRFLDVPISETVAASADIERAKDRLIRGEGKSTAVLKRRKS